MFSSNLLNKFVYLYVNNDLRSLDFLSSDNFAPRSIMSYSSLGCVIRAYDTTN